MDSYLIVLRLVHIIAGTFWAGSALMGVGFLEPAVRASGPEGGRVMNRLVKDAHFSMAMAVSSLLTIISGLLLYWRISAGLTWAWVTTNTGLAFAIGGIAGMTAFFMGMLLMAPTAGRLTALGTQLETAGGPPLPEQMQQMTMLQDRLRFMSLLEAPLMIVAVVLMATARYL